MSYAIIMIYINITSFVPISELEKDHSMIETRPLKNDVILLQSILNSLLCSIFARILQSCSSVVMLWIIPQMVKL